MKPLASLAHNDWDYWKAQHLLNRAGFGGTPARVRGLANMGLDEAVDYIVDYHGIDPEPVRVDSFDHDIMYPLSPEDRRKQRDAQLRSDEATLSEFRRRRQMAQRADRRQMRDIQQWWMTRMIETPRPLEEDAFLRSSHGMRLLEADVVEMADNRLTVIRPLLTDEVHRAVLGLAESGD